MKFLHREIHAFEDTQRNFEQLESLVAGGTLDTVTAALVRANLGLPAHSYGVASWVGNGLLAQGVTINHTLGHTPTSVLLTPFGWKGYGVVATTGASNFTTTWYAAAAPDFSGVVTYFGFWLAIG